MKLKKLLAVLMIAVLVLAVGCSNNANDNATDTPDETGETVTEEKVDEVEESDSGIVTELDGEVEVVFWHGMGGGQEATLISLTEQFMAENENIKIDLQNQGNYGDLSQKLVATSQSPSNLPTITQAYPDWVLPMINEGLVIPLDDYINNEVIGFDNWDDILSGLRAGVEYEGKIYGIPFNKSTEVIWYNKTLFDELGLEVPTTYEELEEVSKTITAEKGIPAAGFDSLANYMSTYLINNGVEFDADLDITGDAVREAAQYHMDGIVGEYFRIAGTDRYLSGPFASEQMAMYIGSNAGETYVREGVDGKFEYAAAPYPSEKSIQQGTDIYMFENATPEQRTAAYEYLKYLTSKDAQIEWALGTGYMPVRESAIQDEAYSSSGSAIAPILADATENLYTRPLAPGSQQAYNDTGAMLEELLSSPNNDVDQALENFKPIYDSAWQQ